jgi:hypothetical protein
MGVKGLERQVHETKVLEVIPQHYTYVHRKTDDLDEVNSEV